MIKKVENCLYCGEKMESITAKKRFCSSKCRTYFNREKPKFSGVMIKSHEEDEYKPLMVFNKKKEPPYKITDPKIQRVYEDGQKAIEEKKMASVSPEIEGQIKEIMAEKCPSFLTPKQHKKSQENRIKELKEQLS